MTFIETYRKKFENVNKRREGEPSEIVKIKEDAFRVFEEMGFPAAKDALWRWTDISKLKQDWKESSALPRTLSVEEREKIEQIPESYRAVFVDGIFLQEESALPPEIQVYTFEEAFKKIGDEIKELLEPVNIGLDAFDALNEAFFKNGFVVNILPNTIVSKPVAFVFLSTKNSSDNATRLRNFIFLGENSLAEVAEYYFSSAEANSWTHNVTKILLKRKAALKHWKLVDESSRTIHFSKTLLKQNTESFYQSFTLLLGGELSRCAVIAEECAGARCEINGLCLSNGSQQHDFITVVDHQETGGESHQLFKGIFADASRGFFHGRVFVRRDAQNVEANQTNKNLLLSNAAKVTSEPQLEILADNVKCSHGSAIGQVDEASVFYLRSRGIGEFEAKKILVQGFAREVMDGIDRLPVREFVLKCIDEKLSETFKEGK